MSDRDYYEILGLTPRADGTMVDQAYWHLARKYQALAETNPRARAMLDELNEAYGVLGTPRLREQYDAFRDDVLIESGVIQPVASKPKPQKTKEPKVRKASKKREHRAGEPPSGRFAIAVPHLRVPREHWTWYAGGATVAALLGVGVWFSLSPLLVVGALCAVAALALTRTLKRQLPDVSLTLPQVSVPALKAPHIDMPKVGELAKLRASGSKDDALDANELRASTAAMIARWRGSIGLRESAAGAAAADPAADGPSTTLVDIVRTERELEAQDAPLAAVIDILRGSSRTIETK